MGLSFFTASSGMGKIRGTQIAKYLGAKINPRDGYMDDVCIYVKDKPTLPMPKNTYFDVGDQIMHPRFMREYPDFTLIGISLSQIEVLRSRFKNEIVYIPENHCNYENYVNPYRKPKVAGVLGGWNSFRYSHDKFRWMLKSIGLEWKFEPNYARRSDVINFYKTIDIQVVYRPGIENSALCNPLKLANAGSFGIPSIAYPEPSYVSDFGENFIEGNDIDQIFEGVKKLVFDESCYQMWREKAIERSKAFHIEPVSRLYLALDEE